MLLLDLFINWIVALGSENRRKRILLKCQLLHIEEKPPKTVWICKEQKTNETYIVSIEKKNAKE